MVQRQIFKIKITWTQKYATKKLAGSTEVQFPGFSRSAGRWSVFESNVKYLDLIVKYPNFLVINQVCTLVEILYHLSNLQSNIKVLNRFNKISAH